MAKINMERIIKVADSRGAEEAVNIMIQDRKNDLKEIYIGINKARIENRSKLYHELLKKVTQISTRKDIVSHLIAETEDGKSTVLLGNQFDLAVVELIKEQLVVDGGVRLQSPQAEVLVSFSKQEVD